jgi:pimeloyl-ACP methyl ester carboxylesterase
MTASPAPVEFQTRDGVTLRGLHWAGGDAWLVFVHDGDGESDLDSWRPLIPRLLDDGWSMLAFDLRGHGASEGEGNDLEIASDLMAATALARERGAAWVAVLAAGQSAVAALESVPDMSVDALVLLSPTVTDGMPLETLRGRGEAKLFAVGGEDMALQKAVSRLRNSSIGWAMQVTVPTGAQGTALLRDRLASQVIERIVPFVAEQRMLSRTRFIRPTPPD